MTSCNICVSWQIDGFLRSIKHNTKHMGKSFIENSHLLSMVAHYSACDKRIYTLLMSVNITVSPLHRPLNLANIPNPPCGNRPCLKQNVGEIHRAGAVMHHEPDGDGAYSAETLRRGIPCVLLKENHNTTILFSE